MTTIVCISDVHADRDTMGVPRFDEASRAMWVAAHHAETIKADAFLFLGDLADPDTNGGTLRSAALAVDVACYLALHGVRSVWVAGNHDTEETGTGSTTLTPVAALARHMDLVTCAERPLAVDVGGDARIVCLPFAAVSHAYDTDKAARLMMAEAAGKKVVVAGHLMVPGIVPGEETEEMPRGRNMPYPFDATVGATVRLVGHYHRRQTFDPGDGGPMLHVVGAPMIMSAHDQRADPGFIVVRV